MVGAVPLAVGPAGEVVAARDDGNTRDAVLIDESGSPQTIYPVSDPDRNDIGFAAIDEHWVVIGVVHAPRGANGVLPTLTRIDAVDRADGAVRTVVQTSAEDLRTGGRTIDSLAMRDGTVYWLTRDSYAAAHGTINAQDLTSAETAEIGTGDLSAVRASAAGVVWDAVGASPQDRTPEVGVAAELPKPVTEALTNDYERTSLTADGDAYAWLTGATDAVTGVARWSPESGLVRITGDILGTASRQPPMWLSGPYVLIGTGASPSGAAGTVVDTRSGAVIEVPYAVAGAGGGTIAATVPADAGDKFAPSRASAVRTADLPALTC